MAGTGTTIHRRILNMIKQAEKIAILGPAHPLRGGLAAFNERLAKAFIEEGREVKIYSFSLQYPSFLFPGKSQFSTAKAPDLDIEVCLNSVNPFNWWTVGRKIAKSQPDVLIVSYWLPFMGPSFGTVLRIVKKYSPNTKLLGLVHNLIPHESRPGDALFNRYFVGPLDGFMALSKKVVQDIQEFLPAPRPAHFHPHPVYDSYGPLLPKAEARAQLKLDPEGKYLLFFGFIRQYKGLDILLEALGDPRLAQYNIKALVAGEFYEDEAPFRQQIERLQLGDRLQLYNDFIPEEEVGQFFSAADLVVQPYRRATQSGISQLAYHFERPMLVTEVGGLPEIVPHGKAGYVVPPENPKAVADAILQFFEYDQNDGFKSYLQAAKKRYAWPAMVAAFDELLVEIPEK